jgi:hypothetical protein
MKNVVKFYLNDDHDLSQCSFGEIYTRVMAHSGATFKLKLERVNALEPGLPNQKLMRDYSAAAWLGQRLYEQSGSFYYWVPGPTSHEPFSFETEITDRQLFVDTLFEIVSQYINPGSAEKREKFETRAMVYFLQAWNCKEEAICWGLIQVVYDHFNFCRENGFKPDAVTPVV